MATKHCGQFEVQSFPVHNFRCAPPNQRKLVRQLNATATATRTASKRYQGDTTNNAADVLSKAGPVADLGADHPRDLFDGMIVGIHS